jgi:cytochrome c biogenesis factor
MMRFRFNPGFITLMALCALTMAMAYGALWAYKAR